MSARWRYILGEALVGLRRNLLMTVAVILSVTVSLTLLGASAAAPSRSTSPPTTGPTRSRCRSSCATNARACPAITDDQQEQLRSDLEAQPIVEQVFFESQEDAYERFQEMFKDQPDVAGVVERTRCRPRSGSSSSTPSSSTSSPSSSRPTRGSRRSSTSGAAQRSCCAIDVVRGRRL
jgi:hypothetical protein